MLAGSSRDVWSGLSPAEINQRLQARKIRLRFYDGETHIRVMSLPLPLRTLIANERTVITDQEPLTVK